MLPVSVLYGIVAILSIKTASGWNANNVCKNNINYALLPFNPYCWYDPDVSSSTGDIANHHGYQFETHYVKTEDGYTLTLFRVPGRLTETNTTGKQPFILSHGMLRDGRCWFLKGKDSAALHYADSYDMWIVNARGSDDSSNDNYTMADREFWDYSFDEMGYYDIAAVVEYVANTTNQKGNILYGGHSMGSTMVLVYCSLRSAHCLEHLKGLILLGPAVMLNQTKSPGFHEIAAVMEEIKTVLYASQIYRFGHDIAKYCPHYPSNELCILLVQLMLGYSNDNIYPQMMPIFSVLGGTPVSILTFAHYMQILRNKGEFARRDRGPEGNLEHYNSTTAPLYPLENVLLPTHIIVANNDAISTVADVQSLYEALPGNKTLTIIPEVPDLTFNHADFVIGKNMTHMYAPIDAAIQKINA